MERETWVHIHCSAWIWLKNKNNFASKLDWKHFFSSQLVPLLLTHDAFRCTLKHLEMGAWKTWGDFDSRLHLLDTSSGALSLVGQALLVPGGHVRSLVFHTLFWQSESGGEHHLIQENNTIGWYVSQLRWSRWLGPCIKKKKKRNVSYNGWNSLWACYRRV